MKRILFITGVLLFTSFDLFCQSFTEINKIVPSFRQPHSWAGSAAAISGDYAIIGAGGEDKTLSDFYLDKAGAAYIFEKNNNNQWEEVQKITSSDRENDDFFGVSVAISGNYAIVGAHWEDENTEGMDSLFQAGSAYIYERVNGTWTEVQKIVASDRTENDQFGYTVSISGNYAIIGSHLQDMDDFGENYKLNAGAVYLFEKNENGYWAETQKVTASDRWSEDEFGWSVSLKNDQFIVGAKNAASGNKPFAGAAYIFEKNNMGYWVEVNRIEASEPNSADLFGYSVSIDENYTVVGAYTTDYLFQDMGSIYVFEKQQNNEWSQIQRITPSDGAQEDNFGISVGISGEYLVVGSYHEDEDVFNQNTLSGAGSCYIYQLNENNEWEEIQKIVSSDRDQTDYFGGSVAISDNNIIVGANAEDHDVYGNNFMSEAGAAYIFKADITTSSLFQEEHNLIKTYPQPTQNKLFISSTSNLKEIFLVDINGKICKHENVRDNTIYTLDLENINKGIYVLRVRLDEELLNVQKVVVQ